MMRHAQKPVRGKGLLLTYAQSGDLMQSEILLMAEGLGANYICIGKEKHKDGQPHFHVFIYRESQIRRNPFSFDIRQYHPNIEVGMYKTNWRKMIEYCKKGGNYFEWGTAPDLGEIKMTRKEKIEYMKTHNEQECQDSGIFSFSELKTIEFLKAKRTKGYSGLRTVYWCCGRTGTGKSRFCDKLARQIASKKGWRINRCNFASKTFLNGYNGAEIVIIDDFRRGHCPLTTLLNMTDRYEYIMNIKGGSIQWAARLILITSPEEPVTEYTFTKENGDQEQYEHLEQLTRRINGCGAVLKFRNVNEPPEKLVYDENLSYNTEKDEDVEEIYRKLEEVEQNDEPEDLIKTILRSD